MPYPPWVKINGDLCLLLPEVPILMEVWEQRLITADPVIISAGWLILGFVLSSGLHFKPGSQRAGFNGAKRNTSFVITRKTILERICVSCWKWVRVHKSRKVENSSSRKSVLSQQSWTANSMGFSLAWTWFLCSASFQLVWSSESWNSRMENLFDSWCRWVKPFRLKDSEGQGKDFPFQMCWKVIAVLWCSQDECMGERREGRASCYSPELTLARCVGKGYLHFCNTAFPRSVARYNKANFFWKEMMRW